MIQSSLLNDVHFVIECEDIHFFSYIHSTGAIKNQLRLEKLQLVHAKVAKLEIWLVKWKKGENIGDRLHVRF